MEMKSDRFIINNLTVDYQGRTVLDHVNLTMPVTGCIAIVGPSGCGKTTLLQTVAGLKKARTGGVYISRSQQNTPIDSNETVNTTVKNNPDESVKSDRKMDRNENINSNVLKVREDKLITSKIAYVFQDDRLVPWLTALENVSLVLPDSRVSGKAKAWLICLGLEDALDKYPSQLSGGMRQRVNIARALAFDAPILLLDEPFKGLDEENKNLIMGILKSLKAKCLLLLVSHDKEDVKNLADVIETFS